MLTSSYGAAGECRYVRSPKSRSKAKVRLPLKSCLSARHVSVYIRRPLCSTNGSAANPNGPSDLILKCEMIDARSRSSRLSLSIFFRRAGALRTGLLFGLNLPLDGGIDAFRLVGPGLRVNKLCPRDVKQDLLQSRACFLYHFRPAKARRHIDGTDRIACAF